MNAIANDQNFMKQVDKETFYKSFENLPNVSTASVGDFPYEWHVKRNGQLIAKSVDRMLDGDEEDYMATDYFILQP